MCRAQLCVMTEHKEGRDVEEWSPAPLRQLHGWCIHPLKAVIMAGPVLGRLVWLWHGA